MKALVYTAPNSVLYREEPNPVPVSGEVLINIEAVGICGSDMHAYHGRDPRRVPPLILGHELAGTIVAGPGSGRRVTVNPLITCGVCAYCITGRNNLCANRSMIGMTRAGGFAQQMAIPASCVIELPSDMDAGRAALTEPAATALHAIGLALRALRRPLPEMEVLVIGGGAIGLLTALLLDSYGCRNIAVCDTNTLRRESAQAACRARVFDPRNTVYSEGTAGLVIDAVGASTTRRAALAAIAPGGVVVHIGLQDWESEIDMRKLTLAEISLIGAYTYTTADLRASVSALHEGAFGDLAWVETRDLKDGAHAFADLDAGRSRAAKIVLVP
jgi:alcohol dehydrogenase